jgi:hypothetical protein
MNEIQPQRPARTWRLLLIGLVVVIVVVGLALIVLAIVRPKAQPVASARPDALATSSDECVTCHRRSTPGIVEQFGHSTMAAGKVTCRDCHAVKAGYPGSVEHEGTAVLRAPTTAMCQKCHQNEVAQYYNSRHGLPAYVAYAGVKDLTPEQDAQYKAIPEAALGPIQQRSVLYEIEDPRLTPFACANCHSIGRPAEDGSVGRCQKCHLRHEFSLEQARKPETCNNCHIGPDHPQWEIYFESPHGIAYSTSGDKWNWEAEPGTLSVNDFPAPTCATCHISGFGASGTTHDVGERLTWYLFAPISDRRPAWQDNIVRMQNVCRVCHNQKFLDDFYYGADQAVAAVNDYVKQSDAIMAPLKDKGLLTKAPFDEPIDFTYYKLWHHWGRTAKFGTWMQGPDYVQWHGVFEVLSDLADLRKMVDEKLNAAGAAAPAPTPTPGGQ